MEIPVKSIAFLNKFKVPTLVFIRSIFNYFSLIFTPKFVNIVPRTLIFIEL